MGTPVWKRVWEREAETMRWRSIATALDLVAEAYEQQYDVTAIADITPYGIGIQIEVDGEPFLELLSPNAVAGLSPEAYDMLHKARAVGDKTGN
jgi:hypothetical protein